MQRRQALALFSCAPLAFSAEAGFVDLFNGKNLDGWQLMRGRGPGYIVENGVLVCPADGGGNLYTTKEYANFILRLEWRLWDGGNNGVGIRAPLEGDAAYVGMEIQVLDETSDKYKKNGVSVLKPTQYTGSVYDVFAATPGHVKREGVWNTYEIHAEGPRIRVTLNGVLINDADLSTVKDPAVLQKHPGLLRKSGHIGFLGHGTRVEFRNIRIRELA
ncbi:MAG: hypothetical protein OHK0021_12530 [Bryobacter sp.]